MCKPPGCWSMGFRKKVGGGRAAAEGARGVENWSDTTSKTRLPPLFRPRKQHFAKFEFKLLPQNVSLRHRNNLHKKKRKTFENREERELKKKKVRTNRC